MKKQLKLVTSVTALLLSGMVAWQLSAAEAKDDVIKEVMKMYHKAPKGTDPVCKKASDGKASPEELKKLVAAYKSLTLTKAPRGEAASWTEKTQKLLVAAQALEKGEDGAAVKFKDAVNCKACHSVHKPE